MEKLEKKSKKSAPEIEIREIKAEEAVSAADLFSRLKRLNEEFDPHLRTSEKLDSDAFKNLKEKIGDKNNVILVAHSGSKIVGVIKAGLKDRLYYEPRREGTIEEFYVMPEFRRGSLGVRLLDAMVAALKAKGAEFITAEFPTQNQIAHKFYTKHDFRPLASVYSKTL